MYILTQTEMLDNKTEHNIYKALCALFLSDANWSFITKFTFDEGRKNVTQC